MMANYTSDNKLGGINPYNFVRLEQGVDRKPFEKGNLTGVIHCIIKNNRPLFIPDVPNSQLIEADNGKKEHKKIPFFKIDNVPVIPGSEIRGVIRFAYETLSNSCMSVNNNNILSTRSSDERKAGIIRYDLNDNKWHLYEADAKKISKNEYKEIKSNDKVYTRSWRNYRFNKGKADYMGGKKDVFYKFILTKNEITATDLEQAVDDYKTVCEIYLKNDPKLKSHIIHPEKNGKGYPVYYLINEQDKKAYLSPAQISRSVFHNRLDDLLGEYSHCTCSESLCEACRLFGMIAKTKISNAPSAIASRIRFSDAICVSEPSFTYSTLQELASPKISSVEFYTTSPKTKYLWTYDTPGVEVNGRKFYFHHKSGFKSKEKTNRNVTAELLDTNNEFKFDVFFENITENELKKLIWVLSIGENRIDGKQQHKIGHAKPLGLGSVKIIVDSVKIREFDENILKYTVKTDKSDYFSAIPFDENSSYFNDYMKITDFNYIAGKQIKYPYGYDSSGRNPKTNHGSLVWFKANHNDGKIVRTGNPCTIGYTLPKLTDKEKLPIPALVK